MRSHMRHLVNRVQSIFRAQFKRKGKVAVNVSRTSGVEISDIFPEVGVPASQLMRISSGLVMHSECPALARALLSRSTDMLVTPMALEDVRYIPQKAFVGKNDLGEYWFGYADHFQTEGIEIPLALLNLLRLHFADDKESFLVAKDKKIIGLISLQSI